MRSAYRAYLRRFFPAILAYVVVLFAAMYALRQVEALPLRALIALAPMLPIVLVARAIVLFVRDSDELERRVELEALALAALLLSTGSFALGLLVLADVLPIPGGIALIWVMPSYLFLYGTCKCFAARRYR